MSENKQGDSVAHEDTEGHGRRAPLTTPEGDDEDTEGHGIFDESDFPRKI